MRYLLHTIAIAMLIGSTVGCSVSVVSRVAAFQLDIDSRCEYDPDALWHSLSQEELDDPKNEAVKKLVDAGTPCSVFFIGDQVRFYIFYGQWRPCTLEVLNEDETVRTVVRVDTPPTGTVHIPLELLGIDPEEHGSLRFTTVADHWDQPGDGAKENDFTLLNPKIGVKSEALTHESLMELGLGHGTEKVIERPGGKMTKKEWSTSTTSSTIHFRPEDCTLFAEVDRSSLVAGHSGKVVAEWWWARQAAEHYISSSNGE